MRQRRRLALRWLLAAAPMLAPLAAAGDGPWAMEQSLEDSRKEEESGEPPPSAAARGAKAAVRVELVAAAGKTTFAAPLAAGAFALDEPHRFKNRATIPLPEGGGAEVLLLTRLLLSRDGAALDVDLRASAEVVGVMPARDGESSSETDLRGRRASRRERFSLPVHASRIVEIAFSPSGAPIPFRLHLAVTHETRDEAEEFMDLLGAAPVVSELWRMRLRAVRHRAPVGAAAEPARPAEEESIELWARNGEAAVYRYGQEKAGGGTEEFFELRLTPSEEDGAATLETAAEGNLRRSDGARFAVNRRDVHLASSRSTVSLRYLDARGEGFTFDILVERVPVVSAWPEGAPRP